MSPERGALLRRTVRWIVSLAAVAFVVWILPFRDRCTESGCQDGIFTTFRRTNVPMLGAMFGVYLLGSLAWAARWSALLRVADVRLPLLAAWRVTIEAQAGGILLPGGVAGDALRVAYAKERAPAASLAKVTATIMVNRVVGLVTLAMLALGLALAFRAGGELGLALPMLGAIPVGAAAALWILRLPALREGRLMTTKVGERVLKPMLEYVASPSVPRALGQSFLFSLIVSGCQLLVVRGLVATVGASANVGGEGWMHVGAAFGMIVGALPITPGGWGTADAAYVFFLGRAGVAPASAAAVCLLYRLMWYAIGSMGAVSAFARGTAPLPPGEER